MSWSDTVARQERHSSSSGRSTSSTVSRRDFLIGTTRASVAFALLPAAAPPQTASRRIAWSDLEPVRARAERFGLRRASFAARIQQLHQDNLRRVREGDVDHLIFYALQSTRVTTEPPIEPALSAKALVEGLPAAERDAFLETGRAGFARIPADARARLSAFSRVLDSPTTDTRVISFRDIAKGLAPDRARRDAALRREYLRAMRFIYEKEFIARRSADSGDAVAELYRTRGLSTDTEIEAGYLVSTGLGVLKALDAGRRVRRVLIVGPGLDLAPRTGLLEVGPPESYQPWAVIDALVALGLSRLDDLHVVGADINPRVVRHLARARSSPPTLTLVSGIAESGTVTLSNEYRDYFAGLGRRVGEEEPAPRAASGHLARRVRISNEVARTLSAEPLDIVTERLTAAPFDLVVATNILPYFDDRSLTLAIGNVSGMLAPGGIFVHNETRPLMRELTSAFGVPFEQSRQAVIATVRGAPAPLVDSVWLHRKAGG